MNRTSNLNTTAFRQYGAAVDVEIAVWSLFSSAIEEARAAELDPAHLAALDIRLDAALAIVLDADEIVTRLARLLPPSEADYEADLGAVYSADRIDSLRKLIAVHRERTASAPRSCAWSTDTLASLAPMK